MTGTIIFACFCSAGIALCLTYIGFTLISEYRRRRRNPKEKERAQERYQYYEAYETEDSLNIDLE